MKEIIIHVGAGKCGSSSLQRFLTYNSQFRSGDGRTVSYYCVDRNGRVMNPDAIRRSLVSKPVYRSTAAARSDEAFVRLEKAIANIIKRDDESVIPVISNEGFSNGRGARYFADSDIFKMRDVKFKVLLYVRPQIEWFNSAWWQWGAWSGESMEEWLGRAIRNGNWNDRARQWAGFSENVELHVMDVKNDVLSQFLDIVGVDRGRFPPAEKANTASPQALLDFFVRNRDFRKAKDDSGFELMLNQVIRFRGRRARFALNRELQDRIYDFHHEGNRLLSSVIANADDFAADRRWFDRTYYYDRYSDASAESSVEDGDLFIGDLLLAIKNLREELVAREKDMFDIRRTRVWRLSEKLVAMERGVRTLRNRLRGR